MMHSVRTSLSLALAGALLAGATAPAFARGALHTGTTPDGDTIRYNVHTGQYCLAENMTGSHIKKVTCRTQDEWAAAGLIISRR